LGVYKIFLKNKIASSVMMFVSGVMMFIAAVNGNGNDTWSLPALITSIGSLLSLWGVFRLGYMKAHYDLIPKTDEEKRKQGLKGLGMQILETLLYMAVAGLGVFLLSNPSLTDKALNLMSGGFTILNGVFGAIYVYKHSEDKDFWWKFRACLTIAEFALGIVFIIMSDSIGVGWYVVMGALTTVAGVIEVVTALTHENIDSTIEDGKRIVSIIKNNDDNVKIEGKTESESE
jgi:uncharacterized membrane protein HdeD (DUF308 family)